MVDLEKAATSIMCRCVNVLIICHITWWSWLPAGIKHNITVEAVEMRLISTAVEINRSGWNSGWNTFNRISTASTANFNREVFSVDVTGVQAEKFQFKHFSPLQCRQIPSRFVAIFSGLANKEGGDQTPPGQAARAGWYIDFFQRFSI